MSPYSPESPGCHTLSKVPEGGDFIDWGFRQFRRKIFDRCAAPSEGIVLPAAYMVMLSWLTPLLLLLSPEKGTAELRCDKGALRSDCSVSFLEGCPVRIGGLAGAAGRRLWELASWVLAGCKEP